MRYAPWLFATIFLQACDEQPRARPQHAEWVEHAPSVAKHFTVLSNGGARRLIVFGTGGSNDTIADRLIAPDSADANCTGCISAKRLAVLSTTYLPYISALGRAERIVGSEHLDQVRDVEVKKLIGKGLVTDIGTADGSDREAVLALAPDLVLGYPFGRNSGEMDLAGVPLLLVAEYLEPHPLGRAEWLKFFGTLLGKEQLADSLFSGIAERYEKAQARVGAETRPKVLFGSQWNGQWWVPPGNSYMAQLISDAGGAYVFADLQGKENIAVDMETILARASNAEFWGMIADIDHQPTVDDFTGGQERLNHMRSLDGGLFVGNTARSDLFGQALVEPDRLLNDLVILFKGIAIDGPPVVERPYFSRVLADLPAPRIPAE
ncbi:MAG: ABC transporter substrate-binding protein [Flavobacteriales bacterium]